MFTQVLENLLSAKANDRKNACKQLIKHFKDSTSSKFLSDDLCLRSIKTVIQYCESEYDSVNSSASSTQNRQRCFDALELTSSLVQKAVQENRYVDLDSVVAHLLGVARNQIAVFSIIGDRALKLIRSFILTSAGVSSDNYIDLINLCAKIFTSGRGTGVTEDGCADTMQAVINYMVRSSSIDGAMLDACYTCFGQAILFCRQQKLSRSTNCSILHSTLLLVLTCGKSFQLLTLHFLTDHLSVILWLRSLHHDESIMDTVFQLASFWVEGLCTTAQCDFRLTEAIWQMVDELWQMAASYIRRLCDSNKYGSRRNASKTADLLPWPPYAMQLAALLIHFTIKFSNNSAVDDTDASSFKIKRPRCDNSFMALMTSFPSSSDQELSCWLHIIVTALQLGITLTPDDVKATYSAVFAALSRRIHSPSVVGLVYKTLYVVLWHALPLLDCTLGVDFQLLLQQSFSHCVRALPVHHQLPYCHFVCSLLLEIRCTYRSLLSMDALRSLLQLYDRRFLPISSPAIILLFALLRSMGSHIGWPIRMVASKQLSAPHIAVVDWLFGTQLSADQFTADLTFSSNAAACGSFLTCQPALSLFDLKLTAIVLAAFCMLNPDSVLHQLNLKSFLQRYATLDTGTVMGKDDKFPRELFEIASLDFPQQAHFESVANPQSSSAHNVGSAASKISAAAFDVTNAAIQAACNASADMDELWVRYCFLTSFTGLINQIDACSTDGDTIQQLLETTVHERFIDFGTQLQTSESVRAYLPQLTDLDQTTVTRLAQVVLHRDAILIERFLDNLYMSLTFEQSVPNIIEDEVEWLTSSQKENVPSHAINSTLQCSESTQRCPPSDNYQQQLDVLKVIFALVGSVNDSAVSPTNLLRLLNADLRPGGLFNEYSVLYAYHDAVIYPLRVTSAGAVDMLDAWLKKVLESLRRSQRDNHAMEHLLPLLLPVTRYLKVFWELPDGQTTMWPLVTRSYSAIMQLCANSSLTGVSSHQNAVRSSRITCPVRLLCAQVVCSMFECPSIAEALLTDCAWLKPDFLAEPLFTSPEFPVRIFFASQISSFRHFFRSHLQSPSTLSACFEHLLRISCDRLVVTSASDRPKWMIDEYRSHCASVLFSLFILFMNAPSIVSRSLNSESNEGAVSNKSPDQSMHLRRLCIVGMLRLVRKHGFDVARVKTVINCIAAHLPMSDTAMRLAFFWEEYLPACVADILTSGHLRTDSDGSARDCLQLTCDLLYPLLDGISSGLQTIIVRQILAFACYSSHQPLLLHECRLSAVAFQSALADHLADLLLDNSFISHGCPSFEAVLNQYRALVALSPSANSAAAVQNTASDTSQLSNVVIPFSGICHSDVASTIFRLLLQIGFPLCENNISRYRLASCSGGKQLYDQEVDESLIEKLVQLYLDASGEHISEWLLLEVHFRMVRHIDLSFCCQPSVNLQLVLRQHMFIFQLGNRSFTLLCFFVTSWFKFWAHRFPQSHQDLIRLIRAWIRKEALLADFKDYSTVSYMMLELLLVLNSFEDVGELLKCFTTIIDTDVLILLIASRNVQHLTLSKNLLEYLADKLKNSLSLTPSSRQRIFVNIFHLYAEVQCSNRAEIARMLANFFANIKPVDIAACQKLVLQSQCCMFNKLSTACSCIFTHLLYRMADYQCNFNTNVEFLRVSWRVVRQILMLFDGNTSQLVPAYSAQLELETCGVAVCFDVDSNASVWSNFKLNELGFTLERSKSLESSLSGLMSDVILNPDRWLCALCAAIADSNAVSLHKSLLAASYLTASDTRLALLVFPYLITSLYSSDALDNGVNSQMASLILNMVCDKFLAASNNAVGKNVWQLVGKSALTAVDCTRKNFFGKGVPLLLHTIGLNCLHFAQMAAELQTPFSSLLYLFYAKEYQGYCAESRKLTLDCLIKLKDVDAVHGCEACAQKTTALALLENNAFELLQLAELSEPSAFYSLAEVGFSNLNNLLSCDEQLCEYQYRLAMDQREWRLPVASCTEEMRKEIHPGRSATSNTVIRSVQAIAHNVPSVILPNFYSSFYSSVKCLRYNDRQSVNYYCYRTLNNLIVPNDCLNSVSHTTGLMAIVYSFAAVLQASECANKHVVISPGLFEHLESDPHSLSPLFHLNLGLLESLGDDDRLLEHAVVFADVLKRCRLIMGAEKCLSLRFQTNCSFVKVRQIYELGRLYAETERTDKALTVLKNAIDLYGVTSCKTDAEKLLCVKMWTLYGQLLSDTRLKPPEDIMATYLDKAMELMLQRDNTDCSETFFTVAKFCDDRYKEIVEFVHSKTFEQHLQFIEAGQRDNEHIRKLATRSNLPRSQILYQSHLLKTIKNDEAALKSRLEEKQNFLLKAAENYIRTLQFSNKHDLYIYRLLALWFDNAKLDELNVIVEKAISMLPCSKFLAAFHQLCARLDMGITPFQTNLQKIASNCLLKHPHHAAYTLFALAHADKVDVESDIKFLISRASAQTTAAKRPRTSRKSDEPIDQHDRSTIAQQIIDSVIQSEKGKVVKHIQLLCLAYIQLANWPVEKKAAAGTYKMPATLYLPKLKDLQVHIPTAHLPVDMIGKYQQSLVTVHSFANQFTLVGGLNQPKKVSCIGSDGVVRSQLVKGRDDLRQDSVMQQVFAAVNEVLRHSADKRLAVRTYIILPLSKTSGILQWCDGTVPFGQWLIAGSGNKAPAQRRYRPSDWPADVCRQFLADSAGKSPRDKLVAFRHICDNFKPVFRFFFTEHFVHAHDWYLKRVAYTRSVAVNSMVGYVVGLGDRHVQNILLDYETAEVIHIDLGVAFEQGKLLPTPETVPFRLTRSVVDGFPAGIEGHFVRSCEHALAALRGSRDILVAILSVLIYDPLYLWTMSPLQMIRLQQHRDKVARQGDDLADTGQSVASISAVLAPTVQGDDLQVRNEMAKRALLSVENKLNGLESGSLLSLAGQVRFLIQEASSESNLSRLFAGWQPYI